MSTKFLLVFSLSPLFSRCSALFITIRLLSLFFQAFSLQRLRMFLEAFAATSPGIIARSFLHRHLVVRREGRTEGEREGGREGALKENRRERCYVSIFLSSRT